MYYKKSKAYTGIKYARKPNKSTKIYVKRSINRAFAQRVEDKYHDIFGTLNVISGTYNIQLINGLTQSSGDFSRVGNEVCSLKLMSRLGITFPDATNRVRCLIVWDKQVNATFPVASDLFTYTANPVDSFLNPDSKARFHVIYDKLWVGGNAGPVAKQINKTFNLRKKRVLYKGITDTVASINTNALYLITVSDSGIAPHPDVSYMFRYVYSDS